MKIGKIEILTRKELSRRLRVERKDGYRNACAQIAWADHVLIGNQAVLRGCNINGKVVLMGDNTWITDNTIQRGIIGIRVM